MLTLNSAPEQNLKRNKKKQKTNNYTYCLKRWSCTFYYVVYVYASLNVKQC